MLNRPPSLPNLGSGFVEGVKPNPLLVGYGALRNNVRSPTQSGSVHGGSILHDYTFRNQQPNHSVHQPAPSQSQPQFQPSKTLPTAPPTFTTWTPFTNKHPPEAQAPLRATPFAVNPTGQSTTPTNGGMTPLAPATTPLTGSFFRQEFSAPDRQQPNSMHVSQSARQHAAEPNRHPRPEDLNEISNLKARLSEAHATIDDLRRQLAQEKQKSASLQSRLGTQNGTTTSYTLQNGAYLNSATDNIPNQVRNPFGGTAFTVPNQPSNTYTSTARTVISSGLQTFQQAAVPSQQPVLIHSSLGRAASVGVLPRPTNESYTSTQILSRPVQDPGISRALFNIQPPATATPAVAATQTITTVQSSAPAVNVSSRLDNTVRKETQEDTLGEQTSSTDLLRSQNKLKEANQRIRYLAEENDRLVARLLQLKSLQNEQQKVVEQLTQRIESSSAGKSDVEAKQAQLEADLVRQHQYAQELLAVCQHLQRELDQERSRQERPTEGARSNPPEPKPAESFDETPAVQQLDAPKKKKKKVKEVEEEPALVEPVIATPANEPVPEPPAVDAPAGEDAPKPKKKKKAVTEPAEPTAEAASEEKPKKKKKKEVAS